MTTSGRLSLQPPYARHPNRRAAAAAALIGAAALAPGVLVPLTYELPELTAATDVFAAVCLALAAYLGLLDARLRTDPRPLPAAAVAIALATVYLAHLVIIVIIPGAIPLLTGSATNQMAGWIAATLGLGTSILLIWTLVEPRLRLVASARRAAATGLSMAALWLGTAAALAILLPIGVVGASIPPAARIVSGLGVIPAVAGLVLVARGHRGDTRILPGIVAAVVFATMGSAGGAMINQTYSLGWYGVLILTRLPAVALLVGQLEVYRHSVAAELHSVARMDAGLRIARDLAGSLERPEVLNRLLVEAINLLDADFGSIWHIDGSDIVLAARQFRTDHPAAGKVPVGVRYPIISVETVAECARTHQPVLGGMPVLRSFVTEAEAELAGTIRRTLTAPLVVAGRLTGMITLNRLEDRAFAPDDVATLQTVTGVAALFLLNAGLHEEATRARQETDLAARRLERAGRMQESLELFQALAGELDVHRITSRLLRQVSALAPSAGTVLVRLEREIPTLVASSGQFEHLPGPGEPLAISGLREAIASGHPGWLDPGDLPTWARVGGRPGRLACIPFALDEARPTHAIMLLRTEPFSGEELRLASLMTHVGGLALRNALLFSEMDQARRDAAETARRMRLAVMIANRLAATLASGEVVTTVARLGRPALDADLVVVTLPDRGELKVVAWVTRPGLDPGPAPERLPAGWTEALRLDTGAPVEHLWNHPDEATPLPSHLSSAGLGAARHLLSLPLANDGHLLGTLHFARIEGRAFDKNDRETARMIAGLAGLALRNARLFEEVARARNQLEFAAHRLEIGVEVGQDLTSTLQLGEVERRLLIRAAEILGCAAGALGRVEGESVLMTTFVDRTGGSARTRSGQAAIRLDDYAFVRQALDTRRAVGDLQTMASGWLEAEPSAGVATVRSLIAVPVFPAGLSVVVLILARQDGATFTTEALNVADTIAQAAAVALQNAHLFNESEMLNRAKTEFLNMAAHELRTPLATLRGYLSMLSDGSLARHSEHERRALTILEAKGSELDTLVSTILAAARLDANRPSPMLPIDLRQSVQTVCEKLRPAANLKSADISLVLPDHPIVVKANSDMLERIVTNLVSNALTYSCDPPRITVTLDQAADQARLKVIDNGIGIDPDMHERVFERLVRLDDQRLGHFPSGTGLGLYIAREMARIMRGDLVVEASAPEAGSVFRLTLPLAGEEDSEAAHAEA